MNKTPEAENQVNRPHSVEAVIGQPGWGSLISSMKIITLCYNVDHSVIKMPSTMPDIVGLANKFSEISWLGTLILTYKDGTTGTNHLNVDVLSEDYESFIQNQEVLSKKLESLKELDPKKTLKIAIEISAVNVK